MSFGSMRDFPYVDDDGVVWALKLDESNVEMVNPGANSLVPPAGTKRLPPDIKRRYIVLKGADLSTKTIPILKRVDFIAIVNGQTFASPAIGNQQPGGTAFVVTRRRPETYRNEAFSLDSGKLDGDNP